MNHKECLLCLRIGQRGFTPYDSEHWRCSHDDLCQKRRISRELDNLGVPDMPDKKMVDGFDESWKEVPYTVVPPFTARPLAHLAIDALGFIRKDSWRDSGFVYVRTRCGKKIDAERDNMSWSALCKKCFPNE